MHHRIAVTTAVLALALTASAAQAQNMTLTPQIGLGTLEQAAADPAFETRTATQLQGVKSAATGFTGEMFLLRKDRGPHTGRYAVFVTAPAGSGRHIMGVQRAFPSVVQYTLVGADQLGALPSVDVLGVHYIKVKPGQQAAFDQFITQKLNPAVGNLRPDLRFLYYKAESGPQAGSYITIVAITKASRDKYWPGGSDSDDLRAAFTPAVRALATELEPFFVEGTWGVNMVAQVYEAREWSDWFVAGQ
jgi:hypothetical protein